VAVFHYYPPGPQEQRAFAIHFLGSVLAILVAGVLAFRSHDALPQAMLAGASAAILFRLGSAAWDLEKRAQRARQSSIELHADKLEIVQPDGTRQIAPWTEITEIDVQGGRLRVKWPGGEFAVGAREVDNGMQLTQEILRRYQQNRPRPGGVPLFIPLEPK
jgi:hypothetical protein